jgi:hypothetical protein
MGFVILYELKLMKKHSHTELGEDVYYTAANTKIFTGILCEKNNAITCLFNYYLIGSDVIPTCYWEI